MTDQDNGIAVEDHKLRSILKTITWRIIATGTTAGPPVKRQLLLETAR